MRHSRTLPIFACTAFLLALTLIPACGKKSIRSAQIDPTPAATIEMTALPSESTTPVDTLIAEALVEATATETATPTPTVSDYSYVPETVTMEEDPDVVQADLKKKKKTIAVKAAAKKVVATPTPKVSNSPTPIPTVVAAHAPKAEPMSAEGVESKSSSKKWAWMALLLLVLGGALYYWRRHQEDDDHSFPSKPSAPLGGLSPLSGSHVKRNAEPGTRERPKRG
jgi:outer membrane biosynthesis protein TonB